MAYTPTTWTTGDTITASALNKIEQGIANGGGGNIPIYAIYSEGSSIEYCHINGDFAEAYQNWQNDVPMLFTIATNVGTGGEVFTGVLPAYKYDTANNRFIIIINSVSGFHWSAEGIEYWED